MKGLINILVIFSGLLCWMKPTTVLAHEKIAQEIFLKKINQRLLAVLKESTEAQVFLEEDITIASELLARATIHWLPTFNENAQLISSYGKEVVALSKHYSFAAAPEDQIEIAVEFLFQIKRQMERSSLFIPKLRIKLFAKKYAHILLEEKDNCSLSLFPLDKGISEETKSLFSMNALKNLDKKDYSYQSKWSRWVMVVETKESTTSGCFGRGRSLVTMKASLMDWKYLSGQVLGEISDSGCESMKELKEKLLKKLSKQINNKLPACNQQVAL